MVSGAKLGTIEIMIETDYNTLNKVEMYESIVIEGREGGRKGRMKRGIGGG